VIVFEIGALLLVIAAIASAMRPGLRDGEWQGVQVAIGLVVLAVAFYLVLKYGGD